MFIALLVEDDPMQAEKLKHILKKIHTDMAVVVCGTGEGQ